jgi:hypothetical protein
MGHHKITGFYTGGVRINSHPGREKPVNVKLAVFDEIKATGRSPFQSVTAATAHAGP